MADFTLDVGTIQEMFAYPVLISEFEDQSEQRRTVTNKRILGFKVKSPALTKAQWQAYKSFYAARQGAFEKFTFTSPLDSTSYTVRFDDSGLVSSMGGGLYQCEFEFVVLDEEET